jgi:GH43 family beta-xylosidase
MVPQNPVWPGYFADPFVLRHQGVYYAYGTGEPLGPGHASPAPTAFDILRSRDLARWEHVGAALSVPPGEVGHAFWAPEVAEHGDRFFLYYSSAPADQDELHRIRVAVADSPLGPFQPGHEVLPIDTGFSIDAHPFRDPRDGRWYLFFAQDFFDARAGTGLAVVPLSPDMRHAAAAPRPVLRANADWQIYARNRFHYGRSWDAWHTVEGPCVVYHEQRYYCFYSGGNWQTADYGVSYAWADHPLGPWTHTPRTGPVVLRQTPRIRGPGHNSYTVAPDGTELLVYHAWDTAHTGRRMFLDRLVWTAEGPRCLGPTAGGETIDDST